jgi:hypothetical protein
MLVHGIGSNVHGRALLAILAFVLMAQQVFVGNDVGKGCARTTALG